MADRSGPAAVAADSPLISLVIPVYNAAETLAACLAAVDRSEFRSFEVIVVDDGSPDGSADLAARFPCRVLRLGRNQGPGAARNAGARAARGRLLFLLDADVLLTPTSLGDVAGAFAARPELSALFCSYEANTVPANFCSQYKNLVHHFTHQTARPDAITFCGGFGAIRRDVFQDVGGFDERYRACEDIELGYRLHAAGHRIRLERRIQVTHLKTYTLWGLIRSDVVGRAIPWTRIMLARRVARNDLNTRTHNVLSVPIAFALLAALVVAPNRPWAVGACAMLLAALLWLNREFLRFVRREKGWAFALRTGMMTWVTYLYSGVGLGLGVAGHVIDAGRRHAGGRAT